MQSLYRGRSQLGFLSGIVAFVSRHQSFKFDIYYGGFCSLRVVVVFVVVIVETMVLTIVSRVFLSS